MFQNSLYIRYFRFFTVIRCMLLIPVYLLEFRLNEEIAINSIIEGNTPLHQAVMSGNTDMVILLLENGANPHLKNNFLGVTPLTLAQTKNSQMFEAMLRYTEDDQYRSRAWRLGQ